MVDGLRLAKALIDPLVRVLLLDRRDRRQRSLPLVELINVTVTDDYRRRKLSREAEAMRDAVAQRLDSFCAGEWADLAEADRSAALTAVVDTFAEADLSDQAFFAADADPVALTRLLRQQLPNVPTEAGLGEPGRTFYDRLLQECCGVYVQLAVHLPSFAPRGIAELLDRTSSLSSQVENVLRRLPMRTLDAPNGTDHDAEFLDRYLTHVSTTLDTVELFGVNVRNYDPRTTLSVAYISLTVSTESPRRAQYFGDREHYSPRFSEAPEGSHSVRVEEALGHAPRMLLRGEAGSGKTTLLRWIAVTAARSEFTADLAGWNGRAPFLVKLRSHAGGKFPGPERFLEGVADPLAGLMPTGWVHRQLAAGRALLLVDGVDELAISDRPAVRDWIRNLVRAYPDNHVVVTARPHAASARWLVSEDFEATIMQRMSVTDVRELVAHWHTAVRGIKDLPCAEQDLAEYERSLLAQLDASSHLQGLATNPLLCAMLCALNLDRHTALPPDRMGIYAAALDMLLERRDVERRVPSYEGPRLNARDKLQVLQYLAWRLSVNGRAELSREDATRRIQERLATMPLNDSDPALVLDHLLERSGVIREPTVDRIDFVHRTFQEYLTSREAAEQGDVGLLVDRAHLDTWRETIIMAAGHANTPIRHELLNRMLFRAETEPRHSRTIYLLVAACLETTVSLEPELRARIETRLAGLMPPRRSDEARSLASAGPALLRHAPRDLSKFSTAAAKAMCEAVALLGSPQALDLLSTYTTDPRFSVQQCLLQMCQYYDPHEYAERVVLHLKTMLANLWIHNRDQLQTCRHVPNLERISHLALHNVRNLAYDLADLPSIHQIWLRGAVSDLSPLTDHANSLRELTVWSTTEIDDLAPVTQLHLLTDLIVGQNKSFRNLDHLKKTPQLKRLWLNDIHEIEDFSPLATLQELEYLRLETPLQLASLKPLRKLSSLTRFGITGAIAPPFNLQHLAQTLPHLVGLDLLSADWVDDMKPLGRLTALKSLLIRSRSVDDLRPLLRLANLETLDLDCAKVTDLTSIARIPALNTLYLRQSMENCDLSPLANKTMTIYTPSREVRNQWRGKLGRGVIVREI